MADERFPVRWIAARKVWEVDARPYGRIREVLFPGADTAIRFCERAMADEVRRAILKDIKNGVPEEVAVSPYLPRESTLGAWVQRWMEYLEGEVKAGQRSPTYLRRLRDFTRDGGDFAPIVGRSVYAINTTLLNQLVRSLRARGLSETSVVHVLGALRTCLGFVAEHSDRFRVPKFPALRRDTREPGLLSPDEQDLVLDAIPVAKRGAFLALVDLMIRPGEVRALNVEEYDFATRELRVTHAMKGVNLDAPRGLTKSRDRRHLHVTARLAEWIEIHVGPEARLRGSVPLFANPDGRGADGRLGYYCLADRWRDASAAAHVKAVGLYNGTKHSTSTWLRKSGLSLAEIAQALGHAGGKSGSLAVTERYARPPRLVNENVVSLLDARRKRAETVR